MSISVIYPAALYEVFQKSVMGDSEVTASATQSASMTELATNIAGDKMGNGLCGSGAYNKANADGQVPDCHEGGRSGSHG